MRSQLRVEVFLPLAVLAVMGLAVGAFAVSRTPAGDNTPAPAPKGKPHAPATTVQKKRKAKGTTVTLASWARDANAVCDGLSRQIDDLAGSPTASDPLAEISQTIKLDNTAFARLDALPRPPANADAITRMVVLFKKFTGTEKRALDALGQGDFSLYIELDGKAFAAGDRAIEIARRLGARACVEDRSATDRLQEQLAKHDAVVVAVRTPDGNVDALAVGEARAGAAERNAGFLSVDVYDTREIALLALKYELRDAPSILVFGRGPKLETVFSGYVDRDIVAQAIVDATP
jgi:hypothetical protein